MDRINLDHISGNPLHPEVKKAMISAIDADYGNPSSQHSMGDVATAVLDKARESVARLINASMPKEVIFTSSGTESVNHAIKGVVMANRDKGDHVIVSNIEHNAVNRSLKRLAGMGYRVTSVSVDGTGRVNVPEVEKAITDKTILISIMHSNNETGTLQPVADIAQIAKKNKVLFHTDAVDSVGVVPMDVQALGADLVSFASNPFYGPTGVGGLYVRRGVKIWPILDGGLQENSRRAGTENLLGVIGMGVAADLACRQMCERVEKLSKLRNYMLERMPRYIDDFFVNTHLAYSLPHVLSISIRYIEGESVMLMLDDEGFAVSTRSACATGSLRASHVLMSLGLSHADAQGTLVLALGLENTEAHVDRFLEALGRVVKTLRDISPLYQKMKSVD